MRLLFIAVLVVPSLAWSQAGVFRGPLVGRVTTTSATVIWETPESSTGVVRWGQRARGSFTPQRHHEIEIDGLPPDTEIAYELEVDGERYPGVFVTAPEAPRPFSFLIYGDNRSSPAQHQAVVDAMMAESFAHFLVNTGDMVNRGDRESDWDAFFTIERPLLSRLPLYAVIGNHEVDGGQWNITERLFSPPVETPPASTSEAYYSYVYGNVQLIFINAEVDGLSRDPALQGDQERWLQATLDARPAGVNHRFVLIHKGPYSSKSGRTGNVPLRGWLDAFDEAGVNVIFSGHDHYAERGWAKNGLPYVIHGGGGAPLYTHLGMRVTPDHTIAWGETRLGYALVEVDGARATVTVKGLDGALVSSFTYGDEAAPECAAAADCGEAPAYACAEGSWDCALRSCRWRCPADEPDPCPDGCEEEAECASAADCAGQPPPIAGCEGAWGCVDEQCEFTPTTVCDAPPLAVPVVGEPRPLPADSPDLPPDDALPASCANAKSASLLGPFAILCLSARWRERRRRPA